jgi:hypothetical protein
MTELNFNTPDIQTDVSLATSACLVSWNVSSWSGRKKDSKAADSLSVATGARSKAVSVHKKLITLPEFEAIGKHVGWVRNNFHYSKTLPWSDTGLRLLATEELFEYKPQMEEHQQEFDRLVSEFFSVYLDAINRGRNELGTLFDETQYPTLDELAGKFSWRTTFIPVPTSNDFRIDVSQVQKDTLASEYEDFYQAEMKRAMDTVWVDLHTSLVELSQKLDFEASGKKNKLFASRLDTIRQLTRLLGSCNFTNDPKMATMQRKLASAFDGLTVEQLRHSDSLRVETKAELDDAIRQLPSLDF